MSVIQILRFAFESLECITTVIQVFHCSSGKGKTNM